MKRYAIIRGARTAEEVAAYMPGNYSVVGSAIERTETFSSTHDDGRAKSDRLAVVIGGSDAAGWTLNGYVIPRLASGMMNTEEIDLSHPIMKVLPA